MTQANAFTPDQLSALDAIAAAGAKRALQEVGGEGKTWAVDKRVPIVTLIAGVVAVIAHGGTLIWWASNINYALDEQDRRLVRVETRSGEHTATLVRLDRTLATLEERASNTLTALGRVERRLEDGGR